MIEKRSNLEVIYLGKKYRVANWLRTAYNKLVQTCAMLPMETLVSSQYPLDWETIAKLYQIRDTITRESMENMTCEQCRQTFGPSYGQRHEPRRFSCECRVVRFINTHFNGELDAMREDPLSDFFGPPMATPGLHSGKCDSTQAYSNSCSRSGTFVQMFRLLVQRKGRSGCRYELLSGWGSELHDHRSIGTVRRHECRYSYCSQWIWSTWFWLNKYRLWIWAHWMNSKRVIWYLRALKICTSCALNMLVILQCSSNNKTSRSILSTASLHGTWFKRPSMCSLKTAFVECGQLQFKRLSLENFSRRSSTL